MRVGLTTAFWALVAIASIRTRYADAERIFRAEDNAIIPVDCQVSGWTYGECDATGHQVRTRCIVRAPNSLGKACPRLKESVWCSLHSDCADNYKVVANTAVGNRKVSAVIDILAYNDVYEMLQDSVNGLMVGGPSRVVPIAQAMKAKNPNSLVLFAGDTMSPSLWSLQYKGLQMVDAHNAIGVDFASLGNHEFDFGIDGFIEVSKKSNFPWLNANCYEIATKALLRGTKPRMIKIFDHPVYGKITIGLFGIMYDMQDSTKGLYWTDPIQAAKDQVAALQAAGVDMIIALSHQLAEDDNKLSAQVPGIHVIYGGHDHSLMLQTDYGTPYLKGAFDFRSIWSSHIEYIPKDTVGAATFRMQHKAIPITQDLPSDAALDLVISNYQTTIGQLFSRVVGKICEPGLDLTNAVVRAKDAPIAHIFTDAEVQFYGAGSVDVSIVNGGAIRTSTTYPAGTFTLAQLVAWSPFGNVIMIVETDGASLKKFITREMLGNCGATGIILNGLYAHPSGVKYAFKCTGTKQGSISSIEWFGHPTRTGPVLDDDVFKLALNEFLFKTEFSVIAGVRSKVIKSEAEAMRIEAVLEAYIQKQPDQTLCESGPLRSSVSYVAP